MGVEEVALSEFEKLKDEQISRIRFRDGLVGVQLAVCGGVASWGLADLHDRAFVFLLVPWASFTLGWLHLNNDYKVTELGTYIRDHLSPALGSVATATFAPLGWTTYYRGEASNGRSRLVRGIRKVTQFAVDLIIFLGPSAVSVGLATNRKACIERTLGIEGHVAGYAILAGLGLTVCLFIALVSLSLVPGFRDKPS